MGRDREGWGRGPRTWRAPPRLCSASLRSASSPRAGSRGRRWARAPAEPPGAERAGGAAPARNPHFHGDLGTGVPFFFFFPEAPLFFLRIVSIVLITQSSPRGNQQRRNRCACAAAAGRGGRAPRPPRGEGPTRGRRGPGGGGGGFPPLPWPDPLPSPPCVETDVRLAELGRAGGERIAMRKKKKEKTRKKKRGKKSCFAGGVGREIPSLGSSPPPGLFSPKWCGGRRAPGADHRRAPGRCDCARLRAFLPQRPKISPSFPRITQRNTDCRSHYCTF